MDFGNRLAESRKKKGINQEVLAELLGVSRQTIYKWEAGITYPDIDKLGDIAKHLEVSTAFLLGDEDKNDTEATPANGTKTEILHQFTVFSKTVAFSTLLILLSIAFIVILSAFDNYLLTGIGLVIMLLTIFTAVIGYVIAGIRHDCFKKENVGSITFEKDELHKEQKVFIAKISVGLSLIFVGILAVIICGLIEYDRAAIFATGVMLALIGVAVHLFITAGIMHDLYTSPEAQLKPEAQRKKGKLEDAISGAIMTLATALFLLLGFVFNLWHPAWVVFPIGGVLCGFASSIISAIRSKNDEDDDADDH